MAHDKKEKENEEANERVLESVFELTERIRNECNEYGVTL